MKAIIAVNRLGFIGLNGGLPWGKCKADLKHFKEKTKDALLVVGPKTLLTLPKLPGRTLQEAKSNFVEWFENGLFPFIEGEEVWCIGGKKTYEMLCPYFTELHISHIVDDTIGDTMMPNLQHINKDCKIFHYFFHPSDDGKNFEN